MGVERVERRGVLAGGNWILDRVKMIDHYPPQDALALILDEFSGNGGSPYNLLKDLAKLEAPFPLAGVGVVGEDRTADFILADCRAHGIGTTHLRQTRDARTSHTDAMTVRHTGRRTFFHNPGANRLLQEADFPLDTSNARLLHLGHLLLLEKLDQLGDDGSTGASRVLGRARSLGFETSADVVTHERGDFAGIVDASLPALDYFFLNESEAERATGIATTRADGSDWDAIARAAEVLIGRGVNRLVCIHSPAGAFGRTTDGREIHQPSVAMPAEMIAGAAGAGDALAAGVLFGTHEGWDTEKSLELGVCAAAASLTQPDCSSGVLPASECLALGARYGFTATGK